MSSSLTHPRFATYYSQVSELPHLVKAGFTSLIIDIPEISLGAQGPYNPQTTFAQISNLAAAARAQAPEVQLSLSMDILFYDHLEEMASRAIKVAKEDNIHHFRVQDLGMAGLIKEILPQAKIIFTPLIPNAALAPKPRIEIRKS